MSNSDNQQIEGEIIALDVGSKRIGVARINTLARIAEPLKQISTDKEEQFSAVLRVLSENSAQAVVIGLPRGLDGQETAQTADILRFATELRNQTSIPLFLIDEAGTTKEAENRLNSNPNASIDSLAATIFLEDFVNVEDKAQLRY